MTKYMEINGEQFEVIRSEKTPALIKEAAYYAGRTLDECYSNPSIYKREIYEDWREWYRTADYVQGFGISSFNLQTFSIMAVLYEKSVSYPIGAIQITKDHNRLYLMR